MTADLIAHLRTSVKELESLTGAKSFETTLMTEAADKIEQQSKALVKYGAHSAGCSNKHTVAECSCGLWNALRGVILSP